MLILHASSTELIWLKFGMEICIPIFSSENRNSRGCSHKLQKLGCEDARDLLKESTILTWVLWWPQEIGRLAVTLVRFIIGLRGRTQDSQLQDIGVKKIGLRNLN